MIPLSDPDVHRRTRPVITVTLVALNVLVFLYELSLGPTDTSAFFYRFGVIPAELAQGKEFTRILGPRGLTVDIASPIPAWGTVFTSMFIHGGFAHIAGNMLFLWVFGDNVEDRMGHLKYLLFYLAAGVAAVWAQVAVNPGSEVPTIGASGAIAGVLGAYFLLFPRSRITTLVIFGFITVMRLPAALLLGFWAVLQAFSGLGSLGPSASTGGGVAYFAHLGGFLLGLGTVALYRLVRREPVWPRRPRLPPGQYRFRF